MDMQVPCFRAIEVGHPGLLLGHEHDGHLIFHMDGKEDTLYGGRDDMRGLGARFVSPLLRVFTGTSLVCVVGLVLLCLFLVLVCFVFPFMPVENSCK